MRKLFLLLILFSPPALISCAKDHPPVDTTDPEVSILVPENGAQVIPGDNPIWARATDDHGIDRVEFYVDGAKIGEDPTGGDGNAYVYIWNAAGMSPGSPHVIGARAIDTSSNDAQATIAVTLLNP
jgi:hypothetical protein